MPRHVLKPGLQERAHHDGVHPLVHMRPLRALPVYACCVLLYMIYVLHPYGLHVAPPAGSTARRGGLTCRARR